MSDVFKERIQEVFMDKQEHILIDQHLFFLDATCGLAKSYNYLGRFDAALD
jgi:hypothetical protein